VGPSTGSRGVECVVGLNELHGLGDHHLTGLRVGVASQQHHIGAARCTEPRSIGARISKCRSAPTDSGVAGVIGALGHHGNVGAATIFRVGKPRHTTHGLRHSVVFGPYLKLPRCNRLVVGHTVDCVGNSDLSLR